MNKRNKDTNKDKGPARDQHTHAGRRNENNSLAADVYAAAESLGWLIPRHEDDVASAEAQIGRGKVVLPPELADPAAVLARPGSPLPKASLQFPPQPPINTGLAAAARNGGRLTDDILKRMRRDRQAAQDDFDRKHRTNGDNSHGKDVR